MNDPMSDLQPLAVMISSRCMDRFLIGGRKQPLSVLRKSIKRAIEDIRFDNKQIFEVWIHEDEPGGHSWDKCIRKAAQSDISLVLYNGNAGWDGDNGTTDRLGDHVGICHAELDEAFHKAPDKVWCIHLLPLVNAAADTPNERFQHYVAKQNLNAAQVNNGEEAIAKAKDLAVAALLKLARFGIGVSSKGSYYAGEALEWTRMNFTERRKLTRETVVHFLSGRPAATIHGESGVIFSVRGQKIAFVCDCIPASMSTAAARELVGQPFLDDYDTVKGLPIDVAGPVHVIACQRGITETQAIHLLGFPDAEVVAAPFGVYVADNVQNIQMVFIANCRDETTTRHRVQRFLLWISEQREDELLVQRALARRRISDVIAEEFNRQSKKRRRAVKI